MMLYFLLRLQSHVQYQGTMELFVNIYLYEFILCLVCVRIRCFGLY